MVNVYLILIGNMKCELTVYRILSSSRKDVKFDSSRLNFPISNFLLMSYVGKKLSVFSGCWVNKWNKDKLAYSIRKKHIYRVSCVEVGFLLRRLNFCLPWYETR